jgi:4-hydroxybenzoate polyprenyltransferase
MNAENMLPIWDRLWIYQAERLPLPRTGFLLAVFTSAAINYSAASAGRPLPGWPTYLVAWLVALIFFFQLRAFDEVKDADNDRRYRPERPIPRGLISLKLITGLAFGGIPIAALTAGLLDFRLVLPLAAVWFWGALMTVEFFVPDWLKSRPFLYLVSHMIILPLITLFATACEWLPAGARPTSALLVFLAISFINGTIIEIGRKVYAPANERPGVETYSAAVGPANAALLWGGLIVVSFILLMALPGMSDNSIVFSLGVFGTVAALYCVTSFLRRLDTPAQHRIDLMSAMWVLISYGALGWAPLLAG